MQNKTKWCKSQHPRHDRSIDIHNSNCIAGCCHLANNSHRYIPHTANHYQITHKYTTVITTFFIPVISVWHTINKHYHRTGTTDNLHCKFGDDSSTMILLTNNNRNTGDQR